MKNANDQNFFNFVGLGQSVIQYHEYQTLNQLKIIEGYCDFWVSTNFNFILLNYILLSILTAAKIVVSKSSSLNVLPTSSEIKQVKKFESHCLLKF